MTIENSTLNDGAALASSDTSYSGASGAASPSQADLKRGFTALPDPAAVPHYLPQNSDNGDTYIGNPLERGGFLTRPEGWER